MPAALADRSGVPYTPERKQVGRLLRKVQNDASRPKQWRLDVLSAAQKLESLLLEDERRLQIEAVGEPSSEQSADRSGSKATKATRQQASVR